MTEKRPDNEPAEKPENGPDPKVPASSDEPVMFLGTNPSEMLRRLLRRPSDEQLKKYEAQEEALKKKQQQKGDQQD